MKKLFIIISLFLINQTLSYSQIPDCFDNKYRFYYTAHDTYIDCHSVSSPPWSNIDAACENINLSSRIFLIEGDPHPNESIDIRITFQAGASCPISIVNSGNFIVTQSGINYTLDATVSLTNQNNNSVTLQCILKNLKGCNGHYLFEYWDKLSSETQFKFRGKLNVGNYTGPVLSGSLQQAITEFRVVSPNNSCVDVQGISVDGVLNIDVPNYCIIGQWNNSFGPPYGNELAHITMSSGAEIVVKAGNKLTIKNNNVRCCLSADGHTAISRWKSITVEPGATLELINSNFNNGHFAVHAMANSTVIVSDCWFQSAYVGIYSEGSQGPAIINVSGKTQFTNVGFYPMYSGELALDGGKPLAGIKVENCKSVNVTNAGNLLYPRFVDLQYGILTKNSNVNVVKSYFRSMNSGIPQFNFKGGGIGIACQSDQNNLLTVSGFGKNDQVNFEELNIGIANKGSLLTVEKNKTSNVNICVQHEDTKLRATINNNRFEANKIGISLSGNEGQNGQIQNNDIITKINDDAIGISRNLDRKFWNISNNLVTTEKGAFGFLNNSSVQSQIQENTFLLKTSASAPFSGVKNENSVNTGYSCNLFPAESTSLEAYGMLSSAALQTRFNCNSFNNYRFSTGFINSNLGTELKGSNYNSGLSGLVLGSQTNQTGIIGMQAHHGNVFNGGYSSNDAKCWGGAPFALLSQFLYNDWQNPKYKPINPDPANDWWSFENMQSSVTCGSDCPNGIGASPRVVGPNDTETRLLTNPITFNEFHNEQTWSVRFQIYELLKRGYIIPSENNPIILMAAQMDLAEEGLIMNLENCLIDLVVMISNSINQSQSNFIQLSIKQDELNNLILSNTENLELLNDQINISEESIIGSKSLDLTNFAKGQYIIQIRDKDDRVIVSKKIILQ
ncbi:MAG: hypothetical protein HOP11_10115 [Saprospiraceae bacterium]|nr:hypothetical protein [Saprospiraceae bacterium]